MAQDSPPTPPPRPRPRPRPRFDHLPRPHPLNNSLADGSPADQANETSTDVGRSGSDPRQEHLPSDEVSNLDRLSYRQAHTALEGHRAEPGLHSADDGEDQRAVPGSLSAADGDRGEVHGPPSAAGDDQRAAPNAVEEAQQHPSTSPSPANGRQTLPPPSRSASPERRGVGSRRRRKNEVAAADPPPAKHQKVAHQVDGAGSNMRWSNQDRHPTTKAAEER